MVALVAISAAVAAFIYARLQAPMFRSTIRVEVTARFDNGQQLALERLLPQLAQRVKTSDVAREVDLRLRLDLGTDGVLSRLRAEPQIQSAQIHIEADDVEPGRAEQLALETARVFEEQHAARNQGIPQQDRAIVSILDRPSAPRLIWPQTRLLAGAAAVLGVLAGGVLAFALAYLDDTIKTSADVERALGLVTLGRIPPNSGLSGTSRPAPTGLSAAVPAKERSR